MKPKQALKWIKEFEMKRDGLNHNVDGVDCWPVIRNTILSIVLPKSGQGAGAGFNFSIYSIISIAKSIKDTLSIKNINVFILSDQKFSETVSGSIYLKDAHVIREMEQHNSKVPIIALQNMLKDNNIVGREYCRSIFIVLLLAAGVSKFSAVMRYIPSISTYVEGIAKELSDSPMLRESSISYAVLKKQLYRNILFCLVAKNIFSFILRRAKPEKAYVVCYYSVLGMALTAACRQQNIPITDIQHGVAGGSMRAYASWNKVPENGYSTLPDTFFCWTKYDANAITAWAKGTPHHNAFVVGSLWRDYVMSNCLFMTSEKQWLKFFNEVSSFNKKVLITLQSSSLPNLFFEVITQSRKNYCFLIRSHPGFPLRADEIHNKLKKNYPNVFFEEPSNIPIQVLMKHIDVHLTEWSGAVVDAYFEGVKSIVVAESALDYFEYYISEGDVLYASTLSEIQNIIEQC
ncbi:hypothetical protein QEN58_06110 [Halomonas alkaliantarctica]|uniref:Capsule polysaccharide biosynthesis protein n=1 Tax=Halomonas alkaliantarctica TaxID=232346 RepID=A0ABY8LSR3_9GAMM|nr:hypothetical protein [Halomonas alkaliantarctica]WGI26632.1 hypothetical protein QEN58_06110 [Halomonas alkaliantarctica]